LIEALERFVAGDQLALPERVERRLDRVEVVVEVLGVGLEIEEPRHHLARRLPLLALGITDRRSGWPLEMVLRAARAGWRIDEVPVPYAPRIGRSKVTGTVRGDAGLG